MASANQAPIRTNSPRKGRCLREGAFELGIRQNRCTDPHMQFPVVTRPRKGLCEGRVVCRGVEAEQSTKEGKGSSLAPGLLG